MNHNCLFDLEIPDKVESVFVNGKKLIKSEFLKEERNIRLEAEYHKKNEA